MHLFVYGSIRRQHLDWKDKEMLQEARQKAQEAS